MNTQPTPTNDNTDDVQGHMKVTINDDAHNALDTDVEGHAFRIKADDPNTDTEDLGDDTEGHGMRIKF